VDASGWSHLYRLAINTVACGQGIVRVGDAISGTG
jgi:hypothetical protein